MKQYSFVMEGQVVRIFISLMLVLIHIMVLPIYTGVASTSYHTQTYPLNSGTFTGNGEYEVIAYSTRVQVDSAVWLQIHFSSANLGDNSYVTITSVEDGDQQHLTSSTMAQWQNYSGSEWIDIEFNGFDLSVGLAWTFR